MAVQDFSEAVCRALVEHSVGTALPDLVLHSVRPWTMHCQVADR